MCASDFNAIWSMWSMWKYNTGNQIQKHNKWINEEKLRKKNTKHSSYSWLGYRKEKKWDCNRFRPMPICEMFFFQDAHTFGNSSKRDVPLPKFAPNNFMKRNENQQIKMKTNITKSHLLRYKNDVPFILFPINPVHMVLCKMLWLNRFKISERFSCGLSGEKKNNKKKIFYLFVWVYIDYSSCFFEKKKMNEVEMFQRV